MHLKTSIFIIEFELVILEGRKIPYKKVAIAQLDVARFPRQPNFPSQFQIEFVVTGGGFLYYWNSHIDKIGEVS